MSFTFAGRYGPEACFSTTGALLASTDVTVYESDGVTLADLYDDRSKATPANNPVSTDSRGNLSFFADPGDYVLDVDGSTVEVTVPVDTVEVSTDAEAAAAVAAHSGDATAAHAASAVSFTPAGSLVSTTVQAALVELDDDLSGLSSDAADIVFDDTGLTSVVGDDVQAALEAVDAALASGTSGSGLPSTIQNKTTTYTAAAGEFVLADATSAGFTVTLPTSPDTGSLVAVKKVDTGGNTVTIAPAGGGSIDGEATASTLTPQGGAIFEHVGSNVWRVVASMTTTGQPGPTGATGATGPAATAATITTQSGTSYTLALGDAGTELETTNASAVTVTIPPNSSVAFPTGTILNVRQYGGGQVTVAAGLGVTLRAPNGAKTRVQYATVSLIKRATDEWVVSGDTTV